MCLHVLDWKMKYVGWIQSYVSAMIFWHPSSMGGNQYSDLGKPGLHKNSTCGKYPSRKSALKIISWLKSGYENCNSGRP